MPKRLKYEGKVYQFPDEATEEQIVSFLQENAPQPDKTVTRRAEENLANLKTENPFNRTKSLYAGAPDADRSPGLADYLDEKLLSAEKAMVGSVPVGIAKALLDIPAGMASSTGRSIGGETFSQDKSYAFPTRSDQDIALEQPVVRGLGPKKGMAPLLFAGGAYGEAPQTGAPADIAKIGPVDPFNLSEEAAFYRDWQRPPERIENYDQWLAQQDLATRISPIKNGALNPHAAKNLLGSAVESAPQMATILGASWLGGPGAGAVAGSALGAGNAGADTARYEAERGFSNPDAAMTAALGGIASGATEAIPIGDMIKRGGAAALKPGFWNAVRQAGVNTGKNALEEMPQELTQNYIEAMTAADPSRRMEYDISDPGAFAGRQLEIAAKAGLTSAGFSSVTEAPNLYRGARAKPADIIEGRDGATGMQPVDMKVPPSGPRMEKGVSAATPPDKAARVVPADAPIPNGMEKVDLQDGTLLLYDPAKTQRDFSFVRAMRDPAAREAYLAEHGAKPVTDTSSGTATSTTGDVPAAPPPLIEPMNEEQYLRAAEEVRQRAIAQDEADALVPLEPIFAAPVADEAAPVEPSAAVAPEAAPVEPPIEQVLAEIHPEAVAQAVEALAPPPSEAPGTSFAERQKAKRAEPKVTTPVADQKAAAAFTPVQLKQAEQLVKLAYHSEKTADGPTERTRAEREVEREEKRAREMGIDVDAISRSVGREPTGSDGNALPTVAKVVPESAEITPQVTIETSPFMQARRKAEAEALAAEPDEDVPSFAKTAPQRESRMQAFSQAKTRISPEEFTKALDDVKARLPGIADLIDTLDTQDQLHPLVAQAANGDRVDAYTHNGRIAIVRENMANADHVKVAAIHEAIAHLVPQQVFGKNQWRQKLNDWKNDSRWFRDFVTDFANTAEGQAYHPSELAEEAVAFHAQKILNEPGYKPPSAYRQFVAKLREWLRSVVGDRKLLGARKLLEFSDRDLAAFLARSENIAREGLPKNRRKGDARPSFAKSQGVDPQNMADSLRTVTEEPEGGPRTVLGRPERANPGLNPEGRAATVAYEQNRPDVEPQKVADWQEAGERIALEPGALKRLTEKEGQLTPEEVYAAKLLISDEGLASFKDPSRLDTLIRLMDKYVESGRNAARELRARTDDVLSPADRHRQYIMEALVEDFPESSWKKLLLGEMEKGDSRTRLEKLRDGLSGAFGRAIADKPFQGETPQERADRAKKLIAGLKKDTGIDIQSPDFDFSDRGAVLDVMKYLGANRASISDKAFELWQNNILSGPLTHKFNTISNLTNGLVQFGILKPLEGLYSGGVPGMRDALAVWKGTLPGISRGLANAAYGWENEVRRSAMIGSDQKFREGVGRTGKIGGKWGKRIRASYRALLAEDEFFRGVWGEMQAASTAYGIARREGLKGDALTKRMQELQADPHSDAWLDNDEIVDEYLFQEKLGDVGRAVVNLRNNIPGLRYIIPFVSTNVNVAKRGFSFLPGAGVLSELAGHKGGSKDASLGARIAARQTVGVLMTMAVIGMLDDEEDPLISGSPVASRIGENRQAERDFQMRTGGAQSIKLGDDWYSFARLEPFATTVSAIADFITATKKARKSGEWGKEASGAFGKLANQFAEKTFLANLGTIYKATIGGNPTEEIPNLIGNIGGGFIPASGALRQFARMADPNIREVGVWGAQKPDDKGETKVDRQARRILFRVMPIASWFGAEPKVSVYGDEYEKGSGPLQQLFSPFEKQPKQNPDQQLLDLAIRRMNLRNPGNEYYPPVAERSATQGEDEAGEYGEDPVSRKFNQYFSDRELHDLAQTRGKAAVAHLKELMAEYGGKLPTEGRPNTPGFREAFKLGTEEGLQKIGARE
mgnify:CR=1 FL=1